MDIWARKKGAYNNLVAELEADSSLLIYNAFQIRHPSYFLNNSVTHHPILTIFGMQHPERTRYFFY